LINTVLEASLQLQIRERLWQDDLPRMPRHLYPHRSEAELYQLWRQDYDGLLDGGAPLPPEVVGLFAPATPAELRPRYLADPAGSWYALTALRYNRRTRHRFCYTRYWWAAGKTALGSLAGAVREAWQQVPFDWVKLRLGYESAIDPAEIDPRAVRQSYVVAGRRRRGTIRRRLAGLELGSLRVERPDRVEPGWWQQYRALLAEQQQAAPSLAGGYDHEGKLLEVEAEMNHLLRQGGGAINLFDGRTLVGHISWEPDSYREQLIRRCWHINNIIVRPGYRQRGLGEALHYLAAARMNLATTPVIAGLVAGSNHSSLRTAAKLGRHIVDSYVIVPKA